MKRRYLGILAVLAVLSGCSPHFHLDFLGKDRLEEVVLLDSRAREKILLVDVSGVIGTTLRPGLFEREGDILSRVYYRLKKAEEDPRIKGVILRLDTPGGEVTASDILYHEISRFKTRTGIPVVGLMMGLAASGGYYVAAACDAIIAHPSTLTGSIGVISLFPNLKELLVKVGVDVQVIKSGAMKDSGSPLREMTETEKEVFQEIVNAYYQKFLDVVAEARKGHLSREEVAKVADGRIFTATQALSLKLIDDVGYFDNALEKILDLAQVPEAKVIAYTYYPKSRTNIYATSLRGASLIEEEGLANLVRSLKSGFYYLWHPQLYD